MNYNMLLQDELAEKYKYKKLPKHISESAHKKYLEDIPKHLDIFGDENI